MSGPSFHPREGGWKVVFDVPNRAWETVKLAFDGVGFTLERYYKVGFEPDHGGAARGWVRLGAEQPMQNFDVAEQERVSAEFDAVHRAAGFSCKRVADESWTAG